MSYEEAVARFPEGSSVVFIDANNNVRSGTVVKVWVDVARLRVEVKTSYGSMHPHVERVGVEE